MIPSFPFDSFHSKIRKDNFYERTKESNRHDTGRAEAMAQFLDRTRRPPFGIYLLIVFLVQELLLRKSAR